MRSIKVNFLVYTYTKKLTFIHLEAIIRMNREDISPALYVLLQNCQPTTASVEKSFSLMGKLLFEDRHFNQENIRVLQQEVLSVNVWIYPIHFVYAFFSFYFGCS